MSKTASPTPEPVKKAINKVWLAVLFYCIGMNYGAGVLVDIATLPIFLVLIFATLRGKNWARIALLLPFVGMLSLEIFLLLHKGVGLLFIVAIGFMGYGLYLLFKSPAREWFVPEGLKA